MRRAAGVALGLALVMLMASPAAAAEKHTIRGKVALFGSTFGDIAITDAEGHCQGDGGYTDLAQGATVVVRNDRDRIIAAGELGEGDGTVPGGGCWFPFSVKVPDTGFYTLEVSHRGGATYSKKQLAKKGWKVELSIGTKL